MRAERPHVLLGYDSHERYPHPDHLAVHRYGLEVFTAAADPERFPEAGPPWATPKLYAPIFTLARIVKIHQAMLERGAESPYEEWIERIGPDADVGKRITAVEVGDTLRRGRDALRAHRTQVDPDGHWFQVPEDVVRAAYPYEDFELLASRIPVEPHETGLFDGVVP